MVCCLFAGSMEKNLARTIYRETTPLVLCMLCFAVLFMCTCFPLCAFAKTYGKSFGKSHKVGKAPPSPHSVHEHMEKLAPPSSYVGRHVGYRLFDV